MLAVITVRGVGRRVAVLRKQCGYVMRRHAHRGWLAILAVFIWDVRLTSSRPGTRLVRKGPQRPRSARTEPAGHGLVGDEIIENEIR